MYGRSGLVDWLESSGRKKGVSMGGREVSGIGKGRECGEGGQIVVQFRRPLWGLENSGIVPAGMQHQH